LSGNAVEAPARRSRLLFLPVLAFAALAGLFLVRLLSGADPARVPSALIGRPAPTLALPPVAGLSTPGLAPGDLRGGVTVVNVWASWCAPCRVEHPQLVALAKAGVRVVGINYKDEPENARRFLGMLGNPFAAVGADRDGRAAIEWGVYGVPETFIVGPDGTVRHKLVGELGPAAMPAFREALKAAAR
jgi:cytochrome c biogenesis protein CcmG, thiol:disulfide interchange protein DsbE